MIARNVLHYTMLEELGRGGMGIVYKAHDSKLDRIVALKFLPPQLTASDTDKDRFIQEAKAAAAINHPNVCTIHDIREYEGQQFIVMEYVEGRTLIDHLREASCLPEVVCGYATQIAGALQAAHDKGVVHRDIKSENIMVTPGGQIKVMDFGLAKLRGSIGITKTTSTAGTLAYSSPEQVQGKVVDARSDIFSFGVVLYEMLTGQLPFKGEYESALIYSILDEEPEPIQQHCPGISSELLHVLNRALEKDPENRYQSMKDVLIDLKRLRRDTDKKIPSSELSTQNQHTNPLSANKSGKDPKEKRKRSLILSAVIVCALVILAAIAIIPGLSKTKYEFKAGQATIKPLTRFEGYTLYPSLNADGSQVAFTWVKDPNNLQGDFDIYIKQVGTESYRALTKGTGGKINPAWSPDGRSIVYLCKNGEVMDVMLISALGGAARKLCDFRTKYFVDAGWISPSVSWHPDGEWLAVCALDSTMGPNAVHLVSSKTGEKRKLTSPPQDLHYGDAKATFSNDGRSLIFARGVTWATGGLFLLELDPDLRPNGPCKQISSIEGLHCGGVFLAGDRDILFSAGKALYHMSLKKNFPVERILRINGLIDISISKQNKTLAYAKMFFDSKISRCFVDKKNGKISTPQPFLTSTSNEQYPCFSPDGTRILFSSDRSGATQLWVCDSSGSDLRQLTSFETGPGIGNWSPNGEAIVFDAKVKGQSYIYLVSVEGGKVTKLTDHEGINIIPNFSGDGQWIYFLSSRSGRNEMWKIRIDGSAPTQLTHDGPAGFCQESPDGQFLYVCQENTLFKISLNGGEVTRVLENSITSFGIEKEGVYFRSYYDSLEEGLWFKNFRTGNQKLIIKDEGSNFTISPDGKTILYVTSNTVPNVDLDIIENLW